MPPPIDSRSDQELVEALNAGDGAAFDSLYWRYRDWVMRLAYRFTRSHDDSLDVLQETFLYLVRKFPGFVLRAGMTTFLYPVVKNASLTLIRKRQASVVVDELSPTAPPEHSVEHPRAELAAVLARLPEPAREVLLMRYVDDMTLQEIAEALDVPLGTVKSRLHNALAALRADERTQRYFGR